MDSLLRMSVLLKNKGLISTFQWSIGLYLHPNIRGVALRVTLVYPMDFMDCSSLYVLVSEPSRRFLSKLGCWL